MPSPYAIPIPHQALAAIARWPGLFPEDSPHGVCLRSHHPLLWDPRLGLVGELSLYDAKTYRGPTALVVIASVEEVSGVDEALDRLRSKIASLVDDPQALQAALKRPVGTTFGLAPVAPGAGTFKATREDEARRAAALESAFARFDEVAARMKQVYGFRLPRHLAVWHAFWQSLTPLERRGMESLGRSPAGIMLWFDEGGLERKTREGLDARLEWRFRCDPPEFVSVMHGDTDGLHYGLWYDDPAEFPSFVASNYARDSAENSQDEPTILQELTKQVEERLDPATDPGETPPVTLWAVQAALQWFAPHDAKALADNGPLRWADVKRPQITGGMGPALPPEAGDPNRNYGSAEERYQAFRAHGPAATEVISNARAQLAKGKPGLALVVGRELHWMDDDATRVAALELLTGAYEALGRQALAEVVRTHHAHRDLSSVSVYD